MAASHGQRAEDRAAIAQGAVSALIGFVGAFAVVLAGLDRVGASDAQAASGLLALTVAMGACGILLSLRQRMPMAVAWSTPGAALLVTTGPVDGGFAGAVGAFVVTGLLLALAGFVGGLGRAIARIPGPLASAMLAGVLLPLCLAPARAVADVPALALPVVAVWLLVAVRAPRWAIPAALATAVGAVLLDGPTGIGAGDALPRLGWTTPAFEPAAIVSLAVPLFVVTMATQNVTGMAVLQSFGFRPRLGPALRTTGVATVLVAPLGGHAVNLAAITAALVADERAHPDPARRWRAGVANGAACLVLGPLSGLAAAFIAAAPAVLVQAVAGLALLGALGSSLTAALADPRLRDAATLTFAVSASGVTLVSVSSAFWGLVAGLGVLALRRLAG